MIKKKYTDNADKDSYTDKHTKRYIRRRQKQSRWFITIENETEVVEKSID